MENKKKQTLILDILNFSMVVIFIKLSLIAKQFYHHFVKNISNERKSEQAHIPHAPTLLENAVYNEWQFQALVTGNRTKKGI